MAASVLFACGLNEQKLPSFIHISEESYVDGSFLLSCILGQRLRISNAGSLLVCLQHNYQHYFSAGMRLGYNTNIFLGKTLNIIDPLSDMGCNYVESKWLRDGVKVTETLLDDIRKQLTNNYTNRVSITLIIDNISILFNLGASREDVHIMCQQLATLPKEFPNLTIITKMSNCDLNTVANNNVAKLSKLRIGVVKLKSGNFRDVDGKLSIDREVISGDDGDNPGYKIDELHKEVLYKVNDRNIKIFSTGEVGVKV